MFCSQKNKTAYINENFDERPSLCRVGLQVKEACSAADVATATGASDAVNVVLDGFRHLVVNDVANTGDVQASSSDRSCDEDGNTTALKVTQRFLSFTLLAVSV